MAEKTAASKPLSGAASRKKGKGTVGETNMLLKKGRDWMYSRSVAVL